MIVKQKSWPIYGLHMTLIHEFSIINRQNQHNKKQDAFLLKKVKTLLLKTNLFPYNITSYLLKNPFMPFLKKQSEI